MTVSDPFTTLKEQCENADRSIKAAIAQQDDAELTAMVDEARKDADDRTAQLGPKSTDVSGQGDRQWSKVKSDWDQHTKRIRENVHAKKAAQDANVAEDDAEWAESDAADAVGFASAAIEEARYAVLDAALARRKADRMAAAT
jgi:hypothetical protein